MPQRRLRHAAALSFRQTYRGPYATLHKDACSWATLGCQGLDESERRQVGLEACHRSDDEVSRRADVVLSAGLIWEREAHHLPEGRSDRLQLAVGRRLRIEQRSVYGELERGCVRLANLICGGGCRSCVDGLGAGSGRKGVPQPLADKDLTVLAMPICSVERRDTGARRSCECVIWGDPVEKIEQQQLS
jgi:hypothetical protein